MLTMWIILAILTIIHLVLCFFVVEKYRKITKVMLLPILIIILIVGKCTSPLLYLALFFGWIGDILLISNSKKIFTIGTASFAIGHVFYLVFIIFGLITSLKAQGQNIPYIPYIIGTVIFAIIFFIVASSILKKSVGYMAYVGAFYFILLILELFFSILAGKLLLALGFALFIISDATLSTTKCFKKIPREDFYVMATYVSAQSLIIASLLSLI